jgi:tetratricopeptide (TPR) repeat protein
MSTGGRALLNKALLTTPHTNLNNNQNKPKQEPKQPKTKLNNEHKVVEELAKAQYNAGAPAAALDTLERQLAFHPAASTPTHVNMLAQVLTGLVLGGGRVDEFAPPLTIAPRASALAHLAKPKNPCSCAARALTHTHTPHTLHTQHTQPNVPQLYLGLGRYDAAQRLIERAEDVILGGEPLPLDLVVKLGEGRGGGLFVIVVVGFVVDLLILTPLPSPLPP